MLILLSIITSIIYTDLVGYFVHKFLHSRLNEYMYKLHMEHHIINYPPEDLRSTTYRNTKQKKILGAGPEWALPIGLVMTTTIILGLIFQVPLILMVAFFGTALIYALISYSWLHDQFHLKDNRLLNYKWFLKQREHHDNHHKNMKKNYGIGNFWIDKLLRTIDEKKEKRRENYL